MQIKFQCWTHCVTSSGGLVARPLSVVLSPPVLSASQTLGQSKTSTDMLGYMSGEISAQSAHDHFAGRNKIPVFRVLCTAALSFFTTRRIRIFVIWITAKLAYINPTDLSADLRTSSPSLSPASRDTMSSIRKFPSNCDGWLLFAQRTREATEPSNPSHPTHSAVLSLSNSSFHRTWPGWLACTQKELHLHKTNA